MSQFNFKRLLHVLGGMLLCMVPVPSVRADDWAPPSVAKIRSDNGAFEVVITPASEKGSASAILRKTQGNYSTRLWEAKLVNKIAPVSVKVADSGRYVATFDEWYSVGTKPVVIYGEGGRLVAELSLADLNLEFHPNIIRTVSSYRWNDFAIMVFGPPAEKGGEPWQRSLEDSLFIRLYWGEVIAIDLTSGKVRNDLWWSTYPKNQQDQLRLLKTPASAADNFIFDPAKADDFIHEGVILRSQLKKATLAYLEATWRRLAVEYLRKASLEPDTSYNGTTGILLAGQLRLREALPLLRELPYIERYGSWAAPRWKDARNSKELLKIAVAEIEGNEQKP
jgi:hypothetical protein